MEQTTKKSLIITISLFFMVLLSACGRTNNAEENTEPTVKEEDTTIAAVGDSITDGFTLGTNYPAQLDEMLGEGYEVLNFGESNYAAQSTSDFPYDTTDSYQESLDANPEIVIIMLGTNDTKKGNWEGPEKFKKEYKNLVNSYLELESVERVILASPPTLFLENVPPGSVDPSAIEEIHDVVKKVADEEDLEFVDMYKETADYPEWFADGIHPNKEGTKELAEIFYKKLEND